MNAPERAAWLFKRAEETGRDHPTEDMTSDAIADAEFNVFQDCLYQLRRGGYVEAATALDNWRKLQMTNP